jgi:hypothetical protein
LGVFTSVTAAGHALFASGLAVLAQVCHRIAVWLEGSWTSPGRLL